MQVISRIFVCVPREFSGKKSFMFPVIFSCDISRICFSCQTSGSVFRPKFLAFLSPTAPIDTEICFRRHPPGREYRIFSVQRCKNTTDSGVLQRFTFVRFQEYPDAKLGIFAPSKTNSMDPLEINKVEIRNLQREDYDQLAASFTRVYADGSDVFGRRSRSTN